MYSDIGRVTLGRKFEKLQFGGLHEKHALQRGIWVPTQHLLWDQGKPRKTLIELAAQLGGPGPRIYIPQEQAAPVIPPGIVFASYDSQGYGGGTLIRLHSAKEPTWEEERCLVNYPCTLLSS
jgi:hypothetical protein